jgi:hypothetical protein
LDDFAAGGDELLLAEPRATPAARNARAMKRNAPDFTSGQFFALRRGAISRSCNIGDRRQR